LNEKPIFLIQFASGLNWVCGSGSYSKDTKITNKKEKKKRILRFEDQDNLPESWRILLPGAWKSFTKSQF
jgi:hypothetical protein